MVDVHIRTAIGPDFDALADLFWRSSLTNVRDREWILAHPDEARWGGPGLDDGHVRLAEDGAVAIGFVTLLPEDGYLELEDLFVDPGWMRRGVATALVDDGRTRARERGMTRIEVSANDHALAFYESVGFVRVGTVDTWIRPGIRMQLAV